MAKLVKFGGSSLADSHQYAKVIDIIQADAKRQIVVVSAPGKRFTGDTKVTDLLIEYAQLVLDNRDYQFVLKQIISRYQEIADAHQIPAEQFKIIADTFTKLPYQSYPNAAYLRAAFKAHGEKMNAWLMTQILKHLHVKARFIDPKEAGLILSNDNPEAAMLLNQTYTNLKKLQFTANEILVVPGFFGYTTDGYIATFARGGSDITGSILAAGLGIKTYENFTDVSSIYAIKPSLVKKPYPIKKMSYREMRELSYAGFAVFNDEAIIPAIKGNVTINVKNTNCPEDPGTLIVPDGEVHHHHAITGISASKGFSALYIHSYLLNKQIGITLTLLTIFKKYHVSYEHMPSGIDDLTVIFESNQISSTNIHKMCQEIQETLHPDELNWIDNYAILMVVGENLASTVGSISHAITPLAAQEIPINMINQGASKISLMLGIDEQYTDQAVVSIYNQFF
jgi:aspartate kinase